MKTLVEIYNHIYGEAAFFRCKPEAPQHFMMGRGEYPQKHREKRNWRIQALRNKQELSEEVCSQPVLCDREREGFKKIPWWTFREVIMMGLLG